MVDNCSVRIERTALSPTAGSIGSRRFALPVFLISKGRGGGCSNWQCLPPNIKDDPFFNENCVTTGDGYNCTTLAPSWKYFMPADTRGLLRWKDSCLSVLQDPRTCRANGLTL